MRPTQLRPELISLDPSTIGQVDRAPAEVIAEERRKAYEVCSGPNAPACWKLRGGRTSLLNRTGPFAITVDGPH